jgi:hypothetical protein
MPTSQYTIERCRRGLLSTGKGRPFRIPEKDRRTKFFSTFITVVWIRVISSAILAFVSPETYPLG